MMVYALVKVCFCNNIMILLVKRTKNTKNAHIIGEKLYFLSIFFEKSRKCDTELYAKSKKSEKREKNSEFFHA